VNCTAVSAADSFFHPSRTSCSHIRETNLNQPGPPWHPLLGHLLIGAECAAYFPPDVHPHSYPNYIRRKYKLGKFFYIDFWPFGGQFLMIADPDIANQFTVGTSLPKSPLAASYLRRLVGQHNMLVLEGAEWKMQRAMYSPGFQSSHLMTLVPYVLDSTVLFADLLKEKAKTGKVFELEEAAMRLTVDIIGKVTLDMDLNSQQQEPELVAAFRKQGVLMPYENPSNPLQDLVAKMTSPFLLWLNSRKLDKYIGDLVDQRFASRSHGEKQKSAATNKGARTVVDLALKTYEKEFQNKDPTTNTAQTSKGLDPTFRRSAVDQIKTFIFAGHDTTASAAAWIIYLLSLHPEAYTKVLEELDLVFGPSDSIASKIRTDPYLLNKLPYVTAVIKETLRIFPPASTIRYGTPAHHTPLVDPDHPGTTYPTEGFQVWPANYTVHRNETYFPNPTEFIPERHIEAMTPFPDAPVHKDALRPFEKGPRNCIGQELAMVELRVMVAIVVGAGLEFEAVYPEMPGEKKGKMEGSGEGEEKVESGEGDTGTGKWMVEGHRCYQVLLASAKPKAALPGRVRIR
jgi:cytochrome P450